MAPQSGASGRVTRQEWIAVNGMDRDEWLVDLPPQVVIQVRGREIFNLIDDLVNPRASSRS
jgi:hypothetical protein